MNLPVSTKDDRSEPLQLQQRTAGMAHRSLSVIRGKSWAVALSKGPWRDARSVVSLMWVPQEFRSCAPSLWKAHHVWATGEFCRFQRVPLYTGVRGFLVRMGQCRLR